MADLLERLKAALADRYAIERELGRGGMGVVYLATDLRLGRQVAIKVLPPELAEAVGTERFLREVRIEASLDHPNIVPLYDSSIVDGVPFYVMSYVEGESLRERLKREEQLSVAEVVRITEHVAWGLAYAHGEGVIHRDIKPENVLLAGDRVLIADFGIAKATAQAGEESLSTYGIVLGTPEYMSPEQATDAGVDHRSDIYALGCVVYEMLGGDPPFTGRSRSGVIARHINERATSLRTIRPDIPFGVAQAVERALAKVPADRFQTADQFAAALARGVGMKEPPGPRVSTRWPLLAGALIVLAVAARLLFWPDPPLDLNRIVAYPLQVSDPSEEADAYLGDDLAYLVINALDGLGGVSWVQGRDLLAPQQREDVRTATERDLRRGAREDLAGYFLDGRVLFTGDTARVILALHSTADESIVARADTSGARDEVEHATYSAVGAVLLSLLPDAGRVGRAAVLGRSLEAIQPFVQAEKAFQHGRYEAAFENYRAAVAIDSTFALAAVKAAQAASWQHEQDAARGLIAVAIDHVETLPARWAHFARGFQAYLSGRGDTAVYQFERAIELDDAWPEGWMGLGETYQHLLPTKSPQDSLARDAFGKVYARTSGYAPALYHLTEFAIRDGDLAAATRLLGEYRVVDPDTAISGILELALRCAEEGPAAVDWRGRVLSGVAGVAQVYQVGKLLAVGANRPDCTIAAFQALLHHDTTGQEGLQWGAMVGLQSMYVATGRTRELIQFMDSVGGSGSRLGGQLQLYYMWDAAAGADVQPQAGALAAELRETIAELTSARLWYLGIWDADRGDVEEAQLIRDLLEQRLVTLGDGGTGRDTLFAVAMSGHVSLAEGDTASALQTLSGLAPSAEGGRLVSPYESLGYERLVQARILTAQGRFAEVLQVAAGFDTPGGAGLIFPVFLRESLELRLRAAEQLGDRRLAERLRERLRLMGVAPSQS